MCSLFLASVVMFFQTTINFSLKSYYKFHSFRVRNVLVSFLYLIIWCDFAAWSVPFLILLSGDIEKNPGPKFFNLTAYVLVHNFDIIYLSETYLNSETSADDKDLEIPGYYLLRADHPSYNKRGGVCIFYRTNVP